MFVRARCPAASSPLACASMDAAPEAHSHTNTRSTEGTSDTATLDTRSQIRIGGARPVRHTLTLTTGGIVCN